MYISNVKLDIFLYTSLKMKTKTRAADTIYLNCTCLNVYKLVSPLTNCHKLNTCSQQF